MSKKTNEFTGRLPLETTLTTEELQTTILFMDKLSPTADENSADKFGLMKGKKIFNSPDIYNKKFNNGDLSDFGTSIDLTYKLPAARFKKYLKDPSMIALANKGYLIIESPFRRIRETPFVYSDSEVAHV